MSISVHYVPEWYVVQEKSNVMLIKSLVSDETCEFASCIHVYVFRA